MKGTVPISSNIEELNCSEERKALIKRCHEVAQKELFYWSHFHFQLPYSSFVSGLKSNEITKSDLLKHPSKDEFNNIPSKDGNVRLNSEQLSSIKNTGSFITVDKKGNEHQWKLTSLLVSGEQKHKNNLDAGLKVAYQNLSNIPYYLTSKHETFSIPNAIKDLRQIYPSLVSTIIGSPIKKLPYGEVEKLRELRNEYLLEGFLPQIKKWKNQHKQNQHSDNIEDRVKALQWQHETKKDVTLDLRFWDEKILHKVIPKLNEIIWSTTQEWNKEVLPLAQKILKAKENEIMPPKKEGNSSKFNFQKFEEYDEEAHRIEILKETVLAGTRQECVTRLLASLEVNKVSLEDCGGKGVVSVLRALVRTHEVLLSVAEKSKKDEEKLREMLRQQIKKEHPYRATVRDW
eukprot:CAMPEP_0117013318 /NCGR_PEP_ID=MMETSP0472-20121206/11013_1 /TAXON_ID=693140 ORGANISM="Tiarina fusus, Strain LIS" /NCGR_SAMPLE_ID=MMETSP0472 /ASSEMBLY_ACC=CAM_ASM_000603 /LENGTH=401 /DNA_ID=CAMNT_0004716597 /DNA_START=1 /DNA_END=1203 /DNA_ORIENTATION=-